jgi:polyhydroxyalkanoate synthase subunit PhaC
MSSAAAPTNTLAGNPAALKRAFETGGASLRRGAGNWWRDLRHNGGMPATVDRSAFAVGRDLAVTAGAVVDRDARGEVIQYQPTTQTVRRQPVLVVPPPIGRFYFLDLRPGRSFVEYAVSRRPSSHRHAHLPPTYPAVAPSFRTTRRDAVGCLS